jgi:MFS family permease
MAVIGTTALAWLFLLPETRLPDTAQKVTDKKSEHSTKRMPWKIILEASFTIFIARFITWGVLAATAILWLSDLFEEGILIWNVIIPIATLTGLYSALSNLVSIGSTPLVGAVSDKLGRRWPIIGLAMVLGTLGLWLMSGEIRYLALIGAFMVPIAGSTSETMIPAIAGDRVPKHLLSRALGLINTAGDLGAMIGPFSALGILNSGWLLLNNIYQIGGILFVVVALVAFSALVSKQAHKK